jgi:basic membrane lipoprotein Med (substrate-binding protein (PBP1-ABC) superfamily)
MLIIVGTLLILASAAYSAYLLKGANKLLVIYFLLAATVAGVAVASLARNSKTAYSVNQASSGVEQVAAIKQLKEEIDALKHVERQTQAQIQENEKSLAAIQSGFREAYRALFTTVFYSSVTHDVVPMPPNVQSQIEKGLDEVAKFAYPNEKERAQAIHKIIQDTALTEPTRLPMPKP